MARVVHLQRFEEAQEVDRVRRWVQSDDRGRRAHVDAFQVEIAVRAGKPVVVRPRHANDQGSGRTVRAKEAAPLLQVRSQAVLRCTWATRSAQYALSASSSGRAGSALVWATSS